MPKASDDEVAIKRVRMAIGQYKAVLTRAERYLKEQAEQVAMDLDGLKVRADEVQKGFQSYKSYSLELMLLVDEEPAEVDFIEDRYFKFMADVRKMMDLGPKKDPRDGFIAGGQSRLPRLEIKEFDGKCITDYRSFMDIFKAVVDTDLSLSAIQKLFYLKRYLKGDALSLIDGLPLINESYLEALLLLNKRYDNKYLVVTHHVNTILDCQPIARGSPIELRNFVSVVRQHLGALKNLGQQIQYWDMVIIPILLRKLDSLSTRIFYSERDATKLPELEELLNFIERRAMSFEESQMATGKSVINKSSSYTKSVNLTNNCDIKLKPCKFCKNVGHKIFVCKEFQAQDAQHRNQFVTKEQLCRICLNSHKGKCNFHFKCSFCKSKEHNSLLHTVDSACNLSKADDNITKAIVLLPTIKVKFRARNGSYVTARGLVDSGSQVSFIKTSLLNKLNIPSIKYYVNVAALGQIPKPVTKAVNLSMFSRHSSYSCNAFFSVVDNITTFLPQAKFDLEGINIPESINLADEEYNNPGEIQFLVSANIFFKSLLPDKINLSPDLFLWATKYGYIITGEIKTDNVCLFSQNIPKYRVALHTTILEDNVDTLLQRFWEEQHTPEIKSYEGIANNNVCEIEFQKSVKLDNNRFEVGLPIKRSMENVKIGNSFNIALQRLNVLCKKFLLNEGLKERYVKFINEYLALGHAKKIDLFHLDKPIECCYFLPHHAVLKEDSLTTKLRVVFDASARTDFNLSLNDILHKGPVVQKELFDIILLFRTYKFVAMTDIKQMYRQIRVDPAQAHLQLILWKENLNDALSCLQLQTVTYGVTSSSFLATRCLVELARRYGNKYPGAASVIVHNSYIDDFLFGASTIGDLQLLCQELIELVRIGSFELHKWFANHSDILEGIGLKAQQYENVNINSTGLKVKALGLQLNLNTDQFIISRPCGSINSKWTKRTVLSFIGSFFDPLGLAGPIVTRAKEFLQNVWKLNLDWDVPLPDSLLTLWESFFKDLMSMEPIYVNRYLHVSDANSIDLIGYCDASNIAYGACIYVRVVHCDRVLVTLLCSKSRIAPIKVKQTIPRLELNACLLLAKLYSRVCRILVKCNFVNKVLYSDSQIALYWIQNPPSKNNYVARRALEIQELAKECTWAHIRGSINPADCLSRGLMPSDLGTNTIWWHGPQELKNLQFSPVRFYGKDIIVNDVEDENLQSVNCNVIEEVLPISKYSSIIKLQRVVCYLLRFVNNCRLRKEERNSSLQLNVNEYRQSMQTIIKHVQLLHFNDDIINYINKNKNLKSNLKKLFPFMDANNIMRVGGRLENAHIPFVQKHPIILPKFCHFTVLVVRHEHHALLHAGLKLTLSSLCGKYYIIGATTLVKNVINKCVICYKFRAQRSQQLMAALPQDRVMQDRVFSKVGIDYCGPFNIKQSSLRRSLISKGYVCVLVCFVTKSVHLELVSDLTTECFLAAFKRFIARRGMPHTVYCDNASTFKGAHNQLRQLFELCKSQDHQGVIIDYCNGHGIDFKFIPSYSPTWGGLWEAAVKSAKYHFKRIIGNLNLTYEQFNTVIVQVEGILNSRPITQFSGDSSDFSFLTPSHFLINQSMMTIPEPKIVTPNINYLRFWKKCTKICQDFWRIWHTSYLSQQLSRPKWYRTKSNIQEGMLVLLIGENNSPLQWPVGRVSKVIEGSDGLVRAVEIKTKSGSSHIRAINKIAVLPIYDSDG